MSDLPSIVDENTSIDVLNLSQRARNVLQCEGYLTLGSIAKEPDTAFLRLPNFGRKSLNQVREAMRQFERHLAPAQPSRLSEVTNALHLAYGYIAAKDDHGAAEIAKLIRSVLWGAR